MSKRPSIHTQPGPKFDNRTLIRRKSKVCQHAAPCNTQRLWIQHHINPAARDINPDPLTPRIVAASRTERMEGKVALVTGAARGFGRAFAEKLLEKGAKVTY